jgi:hypothetical protein
MPNISIKPPATTLPPVAAFRRTSASSVAGWHQDLTSILGRFNVVLDDVEGTSPTTVAGSFLPEPVVKSLAASSALAALATQLYGGFGEGRNSGKDGLNRVKKAADSVATYVLHEGLRASAIQFPSDRVLMMCLGEGSMAKGDEVGGSPMLSFGRVYGSSRAATAAREQINQVIRGVSDWGATQNRLAKSGVHIWGAASDSLENTTRFASGEEGALTVMHVFDRPLTVRRPYEGYMGILSLPAQVTGDWNYATPRSEILLAIQDSYPWIPARNIHVWTLGGDSRLDRMGELWSEWNKLGVHLVDASWCLPSGMPAFADSGTYAPIYRVGVFSDSAGNDHIFLVDGYAASAEAVQAATLDSALKLRTSLCLFSAQFRLPCLREGRVMSLDPQMPDFDQTLCRIAEEDIPESVVESYRDALHNLRGTGLPMGCPAFSACDLFRGRRFRSVAISSAIRTDPYSGMPGVETIDPESSRFRVTTRLADENGVRNVAFTFRLAKSVEASRPLFCPLLARLCAGEYVEFDDAAESLAGRIRDELEMIYYEAMELTRDGGLKVDLSRIDDRALPLAKRQSLEEILGGYKRDLPVAFRWLELT